MDTRKKYGIEKITKLTWKPFRYGTCLTDEKIGGNRDGFTIFVPEKNIQHAHSMQTAALA